MEPSKEAIAVRLTRLNRQILGKVTNNVNSYSKKTVDRETLLDALTVLFDECNEDGNKKCDDLVRRFLDKYRCALAELRRARVCLSDFEMLQMIGRGHFGEVHMVREKHTGDVYALKSLRKESAITRRGVACYEEERDVLAAGAAPWLVKLQYAFQDNSSLYLVMELCPGGDLAGLLSRRARPLSESDASFYIAEVAHALRALHGLGYVHRDVKPQNILLDRCGHVKLCDFGSSSRLADGSASSVTVGTPDYVAPELLGAVTCTYAVRANYNSGQTAAITACDYWSLGVVAFELVTLRRPFTTSDEDSLAHTLSKIQSYERQAHPEPPFDPLPAGPSTEWRSLVAGLLRVQPSKRFHYLDTLQHPALKHLSPHSIRDQVPPWVPIVRGPEDASHFPEMCREPSPPDALPFRTRTPFAAHVPFIGFSYISPESNEEHSTTFTSHDCTAIDMASYKSAEKLAASRGREVSRLQTRVAALEAEVAAHREETARAQIDADTDKHALQKEITELNAANRRLERDLDSEREKRRIIERTNSELLNSAKERNTTELKAAYTKREELQCERNTLKEQLRILETRVKDLEAECERANAAAEVARKQQAHYKDIIEHVHELRHRRLTEINVRAIDSIAKERALRRQTLTGGSIEAKEAACKLAVAESNAMKESRAKLEAEKRIVELEHQNNTMKTELEQMSKELEKAQVVSTDKLRRSETLSQDVIDLKTQLTQEKIKSANLNTQIQELQRSIEEANLREVALEEQRARTESRLKERLEISETKVAEALTSDTRHREKVNILEHLVRQLEREVRALEARDTNNAKLDVISDTESTHEVETNTNSQLVLLKEQLNKLESQLQARIEEVAALKQETRTANLEKWRKEREVTELTSEVKAAARDVKRLEDRVSAALEAKKTAVEKAKALQTELDALKPEAQAQKEELSTIKTKFASVQKTIETLEAEVDRSRNDIRKLKSELQYSEKRRIHAETQEELANRERAQLRDEAAELRASVNQLTQNNKALQEACSLLEEQLTDLEKLADIHEVKNKDLESEVSRMRDELNACRTRLADAERSANERRATAELLTRQGDDARELATHTQCQLDLLKERLESREARISELETQLSDCESARSSAEGALTSAAARLRSLQEECAQLRTASHEQHALLLQTRAQLADAQEEIAAVRETSDAASAWWRTRETKADATLRQQAKLIDFLQAKVEEANRKKCSLSNKLFGSKGRRTPVASPPLRKANRELREEVERLRARLANSDISSYEQTPKRAQSVKKANGLLSIDTPDSRKDSSMQLLWSDGRRENVTPKVDNGTLLLSRSGMSPMKAAVAYGTVVQTPSMTTDDLQKSINLKLEKPDTIQSQVVAICSSVEERTNMLRSLPPPRTLDYRPRNILRLKSAPNAALWLAEDAMAIGCADGLHSIHGVVRMACVEGDEVETGVVGVVAKVDTAAGRVLILLDGRVLHVALTTFTSALKRAATLRPALKMHLANMTESRITLMETISGEGAEHACATAASGRRVFVLKYDASQSELKPARSFTIDKHPNALLLTRNHLYIAGERVLRVSLPSGALEPFAIDDPTVAAAIKKHTPPKAMLLIQENPLEILICYNECGVFVDVNGKRTRSEDAKWSESVHTWSYVSPFLYAIGRDSVLISYINEEAYRLPPCTCDNHSMTSGSTECSAPRSHTIDIKKPTLLGCNSNGIIISSPLEDEFGVFLIDGLAALRSIGASVESLDSIGVRNSLGSSNTSQEVHDVSNEEPNTGFLADIRKRATQLRNKQKSHPDDVIKKILSKEVGPRRSVSGRRSPATTSEFSTDSESDKTDSAQSTTDLCADMFARQVRFNS